MEILSPYNMIAPVCVGGQLELTCTTPGRVLDWSFSPGNNSDHDDVSQPRFPQTQSIQVLGATSGQTLTVFINSVNFTYSRLSPPNEQPLVSKLVISPVNESFNGTVVICGDVEYMNSSSTTILVLDMNASFEGKMPKSL